MDVKISIDPEWHAYVGTLISFYIKNVKSRVIGAFDSIGKETDDAVESAYQHLSGLGWVERDDAYDAAIEHGMSLYADLDFVRSEVNGLVIVGLYHILERFLKEYFERGIRWQRFRYVNPIQRWSTKELRESLEEIGIRVEDSDFGKRIKVLELLANTLKHGDGRSRDSLRAEVPELFDRDLSAIDWPSVLPTSDDGLMLMREDFDTLADAVVELWAALPIGAVPMRERGAERS